MRYSERKENEYRKTKWGKLLNEKKGIKTVRKEDREEEESNMVKAVKLALFDNNFPEADKALGVLELYFPKNEEIKGLRNRISLGDSTKTETKVDAKEESKSGDDTKSPSDIVAGEIDKFCSLQVQRPLEEIRKTIDHPKSNYKKEDVVGIWEDKEALIEYMVKTKFKL